MKRAIGIDINKNHISMIQLGCKAGKFYVEKTYFHEISNTLPANELSAEEFQAVIKNAITSEGFDAKASVITSMPYGKVYFHNYKTQITSGKDIRRLIKFELEDDFPIPFDDLVIDIISSRKTNENEQDFLVGAVSRSKLQDYAQEISEAGLNCPVITAEACAVKSIVSQNNELNGDASSIILHAEDSRLIVAAVQKDSMIFTRSLENFDATDTISALEREITLTLKNISDAAIPLPQKIILSGSHKHVRTLYEDMLKDNKFEPVISDPFAKINNAAKQKINDKQTLALGLALIGMDNKNSSVNFLDAEKAKAEEAVKTKRNALVFGILLLALGAAFIVNLFVRLNSLEKENKRLENEIRDIFVRTFPDEKKIVNELAQTNEKYDALKLEYNSIASEVLNRVPTLELLQEISEQITPDQNVGVSDISMTSDSLQLTATAADFESVDNLVDKLKKVSQFNSIDIHNIDMDPGNDRVKFNLAIKIGVN